MERRKTDAALSVGLTGEFDTRKRTWLTPGNHNFLRLTRIIECLRRAGPNWSPSRLAAQNQRNDADEESFRIISLVVNSVRGDPVEGENGELYEAMGYVRKSERKSGLRRGKVLTAPKA